MHQRKSRWLLITILLSIGWMLAYANRSAVAPLLSILEVEWSLTKTQLGLLNSVFFLLYAVMQIPAGSLADRYGRKKILVPGFLLHSVGALGSGLSGSFPFLLGSRAITGLGQGTYFATQQATTNAVTPAQRRSVSAALIQTGCSLGVAVGSVVSGILVFRWGLTWRLPLLLLGVVTTAMAVVYWLVIPETRTEVATKSSGEGSDSKKLSTVLTRNMALLLAVGFCTMYGFFVIITWLPYYLENVRGFSGEAAGFIATIMPLVTIPSALLFGFLADRTGQRSVIVKSLIPVGALALALVVASSSKWVLFVGLALYGIGGKLVIDPMLVTIIANSVDRQNYGQAYGLLNFAHAGAMVAAPTLTGLIVDISGSFAAAFYLAIVLQLIALLAFFFVAE